MWPTLKMISGVAAKLPTCPKILSLQPCIIIDDLTHTTSEALTLYLQYIKAPFESCLYSDHPKWYIIWTIFLPMETHKQLGVAQIQLGCQQSARSPDCRFYLIWRPKRTYLYAQSHFPREVPPGYTGTTLALDVQLLPTWQSNWQIDNKDVNWLG